MASCSTSVERDRVALEALFDATGGLQWKRSNGWREDCDLSGWYGVVVNDQGRVATLDLRLNKLEGGTSTRSAWP